jgi:hypothetical protein
VPAQSAFVSHSTHVDVATSQERATAPVHCASEVQPTRHLKVPGSHTGAAVPQSAFERQASHVPRPTRHRGAMAGQSLFDAHCTHCCVSGSQIVAPPVQSVEVRQPTHAPVAVSQNGSLRGQSDGCVHAVSQVCDEGEQTGIADGHPAAPLQL